MYMYLWRGQWGFLEQTLQQTSDAFDLSEGTIEDVWVCCVEGCVVSGVCCRHNGWALASLDTSLLVNAASSLGVTGGNECEGECEGVGECECEGG